MWLQHGGLYREMIGKLRSVVVTVIADSTAVVDAGGEKQATVFDQASGDHQPPHPDVESRRLERGPLVQPPPGHRRDAAQWH